MSDTSEILARLSRLEQELEAVRGEVSNISPGSHLEHATISDWREHNDLPIGLRWERISRFEQRVRGLKEVFYIGNSEVLCRVLGRYWLFFSAQDGYVAQHILAHGYWELSCTEVVASEVRPGMRVVDAGANIGYFTVLMADKVGPDGYVYAIEPTTKLLKNLDKSLFLNGYSGRYKIVSQPLWDEAERELTFAIPKDDTKNATLFGDDNKQNDFVKVRTTTLDAIVRPGEIIDFIKIDVEGAEHHAWRGMERVIRENPAIRIFLEFNAARLDEPAALIDQISRDGFHLQFLDPLSGPTAICKDVLLSRNFGEDWMLFLERSSPQP